MLRWITPPLALAVLLAAAAARAQPDYGRPGVSMQVGASIGIPVEDGDAEGGFNARIGYRFLPHLAVDVHGEYFPTYHVARPILGFDRLVRTGLGVRTPLLTGRIQPYLETGVDAFVLIGSEAANSDLAVPLGGGVDFYVLENLFLNVDAVYVFHTDAFDGGSAEGTLQALGLDLDYVSIQLGLGVRF